MPKLRLFFALIAALVLIGACSKKPTVRPEGDFDAEKTFTRANELIGKRLYESARAELLEIRSRDASLKYAPLAQLRIAETYLKAKEPDKAVEEYRYFLDVYPNNKYASFAQYQVAVTFFDQIEGPERGYGAAKKALEEFLKLKKNYPRNPYREVVELKIQRCIDIIADYEFMVGKFYYKKKAYKGALKRFQAILMNLPEYDNKHDVFYYLALSYEGLGDKEKARRYFKIVAEKHSDGDVAEKAEKKLGKLSEKKD